MPVALLAGLAILAAATQDPAAAIDARVRASYAEAQALQGPLDGAWTLERPHRHLAYVLEIVDPPGSPREVEAAWRGPDGRQTGGARVRRLGRETIEVTFAPSSGPVRLRLGRRSADRWTGRWSGGDGPAILARRTP